MGNMDTPVVTPFAQRSALPRERRAWPLLALVCAWTSALTLGYAALGRFEGTPGAQGKSPRAWPAESRLGRDPQRPTLLAFVHPRCPCTQATIAELERLLAVHADQVGAQVAVVCPPGAEADFATEATERIAALLPAATVHRDEDGVEAVRFGAATSGQVLLYAADGRLLFSGGITPVRGQQGESLGGIALAGALETGQGAAGFRVFGCPLFNETDTSAERTCPRP